MLLSPQKSSVIQEMIICQNHTSPYLSFGGELELQVNGPVDKIGRMSLPPLEDVCQQPEFPADVRRRRERRKGPATWNILFMKSAELISQQQNTSSSVYSVLYGDRVVSRLMWK